LTLNRKVFDLPHSSYRTAAAFVSKEEFIAVVWGGRIVSDPTIASRINAARKALGDSGRTQRLIRTIARKACASSETCCSAPRPPKGSQRGGAV